AIELHQGAVDGGGVDGADAEAAAAGEAAVAVLPLDEAIEVVLLVLTPGDALVLAVLGEHLFPAVVAEEVDRLAIVVVGVLVVAVAVGVATDGDGGLAVVEPLFDVLVLVVAGAEIAGDGGGGEGGALAADRSAGAAATETINHAAAGRGRFTQVVDALVD